MEADRHEQQDDSSRFWREDREVGAVYNVYLKRVTYLSQARLQDENEKNKEFSHLMWETQKVKVIRAGTLAKLVESLTNSRGEMDSSFVNVFLATYRTFATPRLVLDTIIERFKLLTSQLKVDRCELYETQHRSLISVIFVWLDYYAEDFNEGPDYTCLRELEKIEKEFAPGLGIGKKVKEKIQAFKQLDTGQTVQKLNCEGSTHEGATDGSKTPDLLEMSSRRVAEQLTYKDADLFKKVIPHHCLGAVWSRKDKDGKSDVPTVQATIQQFNNVSLRVMATVLQASELRHTHRAKVIQKWIFIAKDLRELKNFSSLKAIITGLQSNPIYRLKKTWSVVPKDSLLLYEELSEIFSIENNQITSRELLMKEATAKFADIDSLSRSLKKKNIQKKSFMDSSNQGNMQGTIPYLGTFLTDFTMIHTAIPNTTEDGLINFEKRRKEFEILAQLKLLQAAASIYTFTEDEAFWHWFHSIRVYTDNESHQLSCSLEPQDSSAHNKNKSASLGSRSVKLDNTKETIATPTGTMLSHSASALSVKASDRDSMCSPTPFMSEEFYVIKASMDTDHKDVAQVYKSVMVRNNDHTHTVVEKILDKYGIDGPCESYCLLQLLPDGELLIPERTNVFYARNSSVEQKFILRTKQEHDANKDKEKKRSWRKK